jgi:hypothetical protein
VLGITALIMEEYSPDAFANRDEPIPVISFGGKDNFLDNEEQDADSTGDKSGKGIRSGLRDRARKLAGRTSEKGLSMQDRLLEK